ncbi:hypothetical protein AAVH_30241 [Aphelenchoides avenae]|nr:hypothetical protein AAVH_30241 [Aphelenchus avenae]
MSLAVLRETAVKFPSALKSLAASTSKQLPKVPKEVRPIQQVQATNVEARPSAQIDHSSVIPLGCHFDYCIRHDRFFRNWRIESLGSSHDSYYPELE